MAHSYVLCSSKALLSLERRTRNVIYMTKALPKALMTREWGGSSHTKIIFRIKRTWLRPSVCFLINRIFFTGSHASILSFILSSFVGSATVQVPLRLAMWWQIGFPSVIDAHNNNNNILLSLVGHSPHFLGLTETRNGKIRSVGIRGEKSSFSLGDTNNSHNKRMQGAEFNKSFWEPGEYWQGVELIIILCTQKQPVVPFHPVNKQL